MKVDGSVALVTGAAGGLGQQFVRQLLDRGAAKVYAAARREHDWNDQRVIPLILDVTDPAAVQAAAKQADDITVLVNNAGATGAPSLLTSALDDIRATFETNLFGQLVMVREFAPVLARNGGGAILDVHSVLSWLAQPGAYSPSKAAFWGLTNSLRLELGGQGTQVMGAHLGYADTPMTATIDAPKGDPAVIVGRILDSLAAGHEEALVDDISHAVRTSLATSTTGRI
jgi:NAD(P)-dependent dehydrogenase (short-subunit alcohol dehydrogenase family)